MDRLGKQELLQFGLDENLANQLWLHVATLHKKYHTAQQLWQALHPYLCKHAYPFKIHLLFFNYFFPGWQEDPHRAPAWQPSVTELANANLSHLMAKLGMTEVKDFHRWSVREYEKFWQLLVQTLAIQFTTPYQQICDVSQGITQPRWFAGATLNIVESCFTAPATAIAIKEISPQGEMQTFSYGQLQTLVNNIAYSLLNQGYRAGDAIAIIMPMHHLAIAIYLAIIKMGGIVVAIAESFSPAEIALRLKIAKAKMVITQDAIYWDNKTLPLYQKIVSEPLTEFALPFLVLKTIATLPINLRSQDITWESFYQTTLENILHAVSPMTPCHILFSSGTTNEPKAIVWNHTTPIKAAVDAYLHHNIKAHDVLAWPTSLGWMMGPWLVFASFINQATLAIYPASPKKRDFGKFVEQAQVTMLGVVPTLVASWRQSQCMENLNWQAIKVFSSTGECSNPLDMFYLMYLGNYKPIIEYCGGTEIGGAYISSTVLEVNYPSLFSTPTMGLDFVILNEEGKADKIGEVAIIPPSLGLSTQLLNADHDAIYYAHIPKSLAGKILRRHGDLIKQYANGYYSILGRSDDAMNLGGIKISAAEIERTLTHLPGIVETAAIAIAKAQGPSLLIIYAVTNNHFSKTEILSNMQACINSKLNPLFKIHDVVLVDALPKTASNKVMRRILRQNYTATLQNDLRE